MMTLTQAERMVRKIVELLAQHAPDGAAAKLAHDYAELARATHRRLEQCALMIEAGQDLQALQLAETPPPLLDLVTVLSFREAADWRSYCQAHNLPWVEPFYDKHVRALNTTYGKGIATDHPFYRDYRRAMMHDDDEQALSILRIIARLNPADQNTAQELERLEDKVVRAKLESLRQALEANDTPAVLAQLTQLESSALTIRSSHSIWQRAQLVRCQHLLQQAQAARERDAWPETEALVGEIENLVNQHSIVLPPADVETWNALEAWTTAQHTGTVQDQDFQRALASLEYQVQTSQARQANPGHAKPSELQGELDALTNKWREAERYGRPLDPGLLDRCQECTHWLQQRIQGRRRRGRVTALVAIFFALVGLAAGGLVMWNRAQQTELINQLRNLETARRVANTEELLAQVPARLRGSARVEVAVDQSHQFTAREYQLLQLFERNAAGLRAIAERGFTNKLDQIESKRAECAQAVEKLAPEFQRPAQNDLLAFNQQWTNHLHGLQPTHSAEFSAALAQLERMAAEDLRSTKDVGALRAALPQMQELSARLEKLQAVPLPLDAAMVVRFREVTNQVQQSVIAAAQWQELTSALPQASTLEEYMEHLRRLAQSPLVALPERPAAEGIVRLNPSSITLLGPLLRWPGQPQAWDPLSQATNARPTFQPERAADDDKDAFIKELRDDPNLNDICAYNLVTNARPSNTLQTHAVFTQGPMETNRFGRLTGLIYDPQKFRTAPRFIRESIDDWEYSKVERRGVYESEAAQHLGLRELIDPATRNYQRSILGMLDACSQETNASPIYRALVWRRLLGLAERRPTEWGLHWSPSAWKQLQRLKDLGVGSLQSGDWMVPEQNIRYLAPLREHFEQARRTSLEKEARFFHGLARRVLETGVVFAGYVDAQGHPVVRSPDGVEYWGWSSRTGAPTLLLRRGEGTTWQTIDAPLRLTPLFMLRGDRKGILEETARTALYDWREAKVNLPPLFAGLYE